MQIRLLITKAEFSEDKLIPDATPESRVDRCIRESQQFDLLPLLGDALYFDLLKNSSNEIYRKLIDGEEYTDLQDHVVQFSGLRMALKYWAYARFINSNQFNVTTHSSVTKTNPWSEPAQSKTIAIEVESAKSGAYAYWLEAKKYLDTKKETYPLWKTTCSADDSNVRSGFRINAVGGDCTTDIDNHDDCCK